MFDISRKLSMAFNRDKCVFIYIDTNSHLIIIVVYVNNFLFISKFLKFIKYFKLEMSSYFKMKDLGLAKWILQIELNHNVPSSITMLSQSQYIKKILKCHRIADSWFVKMSIDLNISLSLLAVLKISVTEY